MTDQERARWTKLVADYEASDLTQREFASERGNPDRAEAERIAALQTRRENAEKKRQFVTHRVEHKVPDDQKTCPKCGGHDFTKLGEGKMTEEYELVPAMVERRLHVQEKLRCRCGETILAAPAPTKVFDKARFGPTFMAQVAVSKCADSLPLYRQAKAYRRAGIQVNDSTLGEAHRPRLLAEPLWRHARRGPRRDQGQARR